MCNSGVQEKVLAAPSEDTLRSAIEIEYELKLRERALGYTVNPQPQNPCTRCGQEFQPNHLRKCWAKNQKCTNCGKMGHFGRMCKRPRRFWALWTFSICTTYCCCSYYYFYCYCYCTYCYCYCSFSSTICNT